MIAMQKLRNVATDFVMFLNPWSEVQVGSTALERYSPKIIKDMQRIFFISVFFYWNGAYNRGSYFQPDFWGEWAVQFPAQMWATISLIGSLVIIAGMLKPPVWWMVAVGAFVMALNFYALALSAILTSGTSSGIVIGIWNFVYFAPKFVDIFVMGVRSHGAK